MAVSQPYESFVRTFKVVDILAFATVFLGSYPPFAVRSINCLSPSTDTFDVNVCI